MNSLRFQNPDALYWLWLIPIVWGVLIYAASRRKVALQQLIDANLLSRIQISINPTRRRWKATLLLLSLLGIIIAASRPGWNATSQTLQRKGRDVVFLLDVSRSMLAEDIAPSRLERAKIAIKDCVERLEGDRVGLVVFAGTSSVQCPLTLDYGFFRMMLDDVSTDSITRGGTLIGDAMRNVLNTVFDDQVKEFKDVILITDGEDHDSFPVEAAEKAGDAGVRLIAIGLGDENEGKRIPITDENGRKTFLKHNGQEVWTSLDADTLRKMVNVTDGGRYLNVATGTFDLGEIYSKLIASAKKRDLESETMIRYEEEFQLFLLIDLTLLLIECFIRDRS